MSVGHIARAAEAAGIPTVVVCVHAFRHVPREMSLARAVITRHPMGRPLGPVGGVDTRRRVVTEALRLLETADPGGTIVELDEPFRPVVARN